MITSHNCGTWRCLEALNVSWDGVFALVLNVSEWDAWVKWMEMVGVVFIATNYFLVVAFFPVTADGPRPWSGWSASMHQWMKSQRSAVTSISTTISALNVSSNVRLSSHRQSRRAPQTVREDAKNAFYRNHYLRVFLVYNDWMVRTEARWPALGLGRCLLLLRIVHSQNIVFAVFLFEEHPSVADGPP
jgi:hypothetical protein